ncbi:hypothetical protein [Polymorphospora sp. NPDC050346]|uniref:hypothetical protein n=1 Tax=Polymorphospora sp. NPDC050346 TaxID=3155780 RepID=UPI0033E3C8C9
MITSQIVVQDLADPNEVFAAARAVAGATTWRRSTFGNVHMLQTTTRQAPLTSVHYAAGGGWYPADAEDDAPTGYVLVGFGTAALAPATDRAVHERLIQGLGDWLSARNLRWSWQYEDEVWVAGHYDRPTRPQ